MTEIWQWFLVVGGGIVFTVAVWEAIIKGHKYFKNGKSGAEKHFENRVRDVLSRDRKVNCPWLVNAERENAARERELLLLKETLITELKPIKNDIKDIKDLTQRLHHSQMTDLQIKLSQLFNDKFDKKGILTKADQINWDKWFSDYTELGGNSDIRKMDDLIQKARVQAALDKVSKQKRSKSDNENKEKNSDEN